MAAVHVRTEGMHSDSCRALIEVRVARLRGVIAVRANRELGLTSVLYNPHLMDAETIRSEIEAFGFWAEVVVAEADHFLPPRRPNNINVVRVN